MNLLLGAQGVGKSTLMNHLEDIRICPTVDSTTRSMLRVRDDLGLNKDQGQVIVNANMMHVHDICFSHNSILFARSIIDMMVWTEEAHLNDKLLELDKTQEVLLKQTEEMAETLKQIAHYLNMYYIPIEFELA